MYIEKEPALTLKDISKEMHSEQIYKKKNDTPLTSTNRMFQKN